MVPSIRDYGNNDMLEQGLQAIGHHVVGEDRENYHNFKASYGASPAATSTIWKDLWDSNNAEITIGPESKLLHFFWALHFLRAYPLERNLAAYFRSNRKTIMKWAKLYITKISLLKNQKVSLLFILYHHKGYISNYFVWQILLPLPDNDNKFYLTVDGTDCPINEPTPFNRNWFSHKFKGASIKYEIGIDLQGNFAWVSPPYRGSAGDSTIFKRQLRQLIPQDYAAIVDSAYGIEDDKVAPVTEFDSTEVVRFKKRALARHETGKKRIKDFAVTTETFRHSVDFHSFCFYASIVICQYNIEHGENLFNL